MGEIRCLLLLTVTGTICCTQSVPNSTWWPCASINPYQNLQLEQVLGQWYMVETISSLLGRADTCAGMQLLRQNDHSWDNLTMVGQESPGGSSIFYENHTIIIPDSVNSPSLWDQPDIGAAIMVTDHGPTSDILVLTTCHRLLGYDWTGVFSRDTNVDPTVLELVNERMRTAGLQNVDSAVVLNTTTCPT